jgi:hypothetical protein
VRQQLTTEAILLLIIVLMVFWVSIAAIVRHHGARHAGARASQRATETRG